MAIEHSIATVEGHVAPLPTVATVDFPYRGYMISDGVGITRDCYSASFISSAPWYVVCVNMRLVEQTTGLPSSVYKTDARECNEHNSS